MTLLEWLRAHEATLHWWLARTERILWTAALLTTVIMIGIREYRR